MPHFDLSRSTGGIYTLPCGAAFTSGIAGRESNRIDYAQTKESIRTQEKQLLAAALDIPLSCLFFLDQDHGDNVVEAVEATDEGSYVFATADALITNKPGLCLVIRTADCVPVILIDEQTRCAGAVHSGWKSTEKKITVKAARMMNEKYGAALSRMKAYILPAISGERYQVSADFAQKFPRSVIKKDDRFYCDLPGEIRRDLLDAGFSEENIFMTELCTLSRNDLFFSHRGGDAGRNLNFVMVTEEK